MATKHFLLAATMMSICVASSAEAKSKQVRIGTPPAVGRLPTDEGFKCFQEGFLNSVPQVRPTYTVGRVLDQTGTFSNEAAVGGAVVTQGATAMIYTALGKFGDDFNMVERTDTSVMENDIALTLKNILFDGSRPATESPTGPSEAQQLWKGQVEGADYYITGAITEFNPSIRSGGLEIEIQGIGAGRRKYTQGIGIDLRIVNAKTGKIVRTVNLAKEISGYETKLGVFNFLGDYLVDVSAGTKSQEPRQTAVRILLEDATLRLVGASFGTDHGSKCADWVESNYHW